MAFEIRNSLTNILIKTLSKKGYDIPSLYFDENIQEQLSKEDFELFSKFLDMTNKLIDKINELPIDNSFKKNKCEEIKNKIHKASSIPIILEYYLEFELEVYKIENNLNEYSSLKDITHDISISRSSVTTIDTIVKTVIAESKVNEQCRSNINNRNNIDGNKIQNMSKSEPNSIDDSTNLDLDIDKNAITYDFYVEKYSKSYNISKSKVKEILKHAYL